MGHYAAALYFARNAVRKRPFDGRPYFLHGLSLLALNRSTESLSSFNHAIRLNPECASYYVGRGVASERAGAFQAALADLEYAIAVDPSCYHAYLSLAALLSTCPDDRIYNGARAVEMAESALRLMKEDDWKCFANLAAAYAAVGQFEQAVDHAQTARDLAPAQQKKTRSRRLRRYRAARPYRKSKYVWTLRLLGRRVLSARQTRSPSERVMRFFQWHASMNATSRWYRMVDFLLPKDARGISTFDIVINSMTHEERADVNGIDRSRANRIAAGAGLSAREVSRVVGQLKELALHR